MFERPDTATGVCRSRCEPSPTWPERLCPQARTPPDASASPCTVPADIVVTPPRPIMATGLLCTAVVPTASSPVALFPQPNAVRCSPDALELDAIGTSTKTEITAAIATAL